MIRELNKYQIRNMAYASRDPLAYLLRLYRYAIPEFDRLDKIVSYPIVSIDTARQIIKTGIACFGYQVLVIWWSRGFVADGTIHDEVVVYGGRKMKQYLGGK